MTGSDLHQCVQGGSIMILYRSFFQRFGHLGVCVLPAEALSNDLLQVDPQTHIMPLVCASLSACSGCVSHGCCVLLLMVSTGLMSRPHLTCSMRSACC